MPRGVRTVHPPIVKYQIALTHVNAILEQYDVDELRNNHLLYKRMNSYQRQENPEVRKLLTIYQKYLRNNRIVEDYERFHPLKMCTNCHRVVHDDHENDDDMQFYRIQLQQILSNTLSHKKFKSIESIRGNTARTFHLCQDCVKYLSPSEELSNKERA